MYGTSIEHLEFEITRNQQLIQSNNRGLERAKEQIENMTTDNVKAEKRIQELQAAIEKLKA